MNLAVTTKFKSAVEKINQIDTGKFPLVLTRIIQKLHLKEDSIFDGKEEAQLCKMLGMSEADLDTVISACSYIFEQAAYDQVAVGALEENLLTVGMIAAQVCGPRGGRGGRREIGQQFHPHLDCCEVFQRASHRASSSSFRSNSR